jgi:hypothetical protein
VKKKHISALAISTWLIIISILMVLEKTIDLEIFFALWLLAMLVIAELSGPVFTRPRYFGRLAACTGAGILVFGVIVIRKIWEIVNG